VNISTETRFWRRVTKSDNCWLWNGCCNRDGYGEIYYNKGYISTHRLSWIFAHQFIPEGMQVLHKCDNPPCVNPDHLFLGTHTDNMRDMNLKGRLNIPKGELSCHARLNEKQIAEIRNSPLLQRELAEIYHVSRSHIGNIKCNHKWKHQGHED